MVAIDFQYVFHDMEVNGYHQLYGYQHFFVVLSFFVQHLNEIRTDLKPLK